MAKKSITERIVTKRFINTVEKINEELKAFAEYNEEAEETAEEYARMALGNESFFQCNLSEFDRAEIRYKAAYLRRRAAEYQAKAAEYQEKAEAARKESITNK